MPATAPTTRCASTAASEAPRWSAKAPIWAPPSSAASNMRSKGGRINTDAIDNSAGVDTSDHEVNLKILFSGPMRRGEITAEARDAMLTEMTEDVAAPRARRTITTRRWRCRWPRRAALHDLDGQGRFIRDLERRGKLDRAVEFLPADEDLAQARAGRPGADAARACGAARLRQARSEGGHRRERSAGRSLFRQRARSYFPPQAGERYRHEMENHRLRREIVTTVLANRIVNLAGPVFVHRMKEISGAPAARVARAFALAEGAFGFRR